MKLEGCSCLTAATCDGSCTASFDSLPNEKKASGFNFDLSVRTLGNAADLLRELHLQGIEEGLLKDKKCRLLSMVASYLDSVAMALLAVERSPS